MSTARVNLDLDQYVRVTSNPFVASSLLLQSHRDTVRIVFSDVQPAKSNPTFHELGGEHPPLNIPLTETAVWALAMTERSALTVTEQRSTITVDEGFLFDNVRAISRVDINILTSDMWAGSTERQGVPTGDTTFQVLRTGNRWVVIEDINVNVDFTNTGEGRYIYELTAYVKGSSGNTFSYDLNTGSVTPLGRNLNLSNINVFTDAVIETEPTNPSFSGTPDFRILFTEHFLELQGNRESISENGTDFFEGDRRIVIPPNTEVLLLATTSGTALGAADIRSNFFVSEADDLTEE